jgi:hypothetical protein
MSLCLKIRPKITQDRMKKKENYAPDVFSIEAWELA